MLTCKSSTQNLTGADFSDKMLAVGSHYSPVHITWPYSVLSRMTPAYWQVTEVTADWLQLPTQCPI